MGFFRNPTGFYEDSCGNLSGILWDSKKIPVGFLGNSCRTPVGFFRNPTGFYVGFLWEFEWDFLWESCETLIDSV